MSTQPEGQEAAFFSTIRSWGITRAPNKVLGGVLSGVGNKVGLAAAPARILFVVVAIFLTGLALLAYAAAWALLPDHEGRIVVQDFGRGVPNVGQLIGIVIVGIIGFTMLGDFWPRWPGSWDANFDGFGPGLQGPAVIVAGIMAVVVPLAIIAGVILLVVWLVRRSSRESDGTLAAPGPHPGGTTGTAAATPPAAGTASAAAPSAAPAVATAPIYAAPPPQAPVHTWPVKPRVPGAGPVAWLLALGWVPLSVSIAYWLEYRDELAIHPVLASGLIFMAGLGLIIAGAALSGRRVGGLGTIAAIGLIPVIALTVNADEVRYNWPSGTWGDPVVIVDHGTSEPEPSVPAVPELDPAQTFSDYDFVQINGNCWANDSVYPSGSLVSLGAVTEDVTVDVTTSETRVVVPKGTSMKFTVEDNPYEAYASVSWLDREIGCEMATTEGTWATLTNPDTPVVTLRVSGEAALGSIYIEEN